MELDQKQYDCKDICNQCPTEYFLRFTIAQDLVICILTEYYWKYQTKDFWDNLGKALMLFSNDIHTEI